MYEKIVQYILLRGDLLSVKKWSMGAVIAQACHASTACIHKYYDDPDTVKYLKDRENMTKIVLKVDTEDKMNDYINILNGRQIQYYVWLEQPENIKTCIALKPTPKQEVQDIFSALKIFN